MSTLVVLSKVVSKICRTFGRGTSYPGYFASKFDKNIMKKFDMTDNIVMVTGTNGKTSTTNFITSILEKADYKVISNSEGANMPQGIITLFINKSKINNKIDADFVVLETDEGFLKDISRQIKPKYLVINNILQDQETRFSSLENVGNIIKSGIQEGTKIIANGDDPNLVNMLKDLSNEIVYYSVEGEKTNKVAVCPSCKKASLKYVEENYASFGNFSCDCGFSSPEKKYIAKDIDFHKGEFTVGNFRFSSYNNQDYSTYNNMAAISLALELGLSNEGIARGIRDIKVGNGRMERFNFSNYTSIINLAKNPAALDNTVTYYNKLEDQYCLYFAVNKRPNDGTSVAWLNDLNYDFMRPEKVKMIYVDGEAKEEAYEIIKRHMGEDRVILVDETEKALDDIENIDEKFYFMANYSALGPMRAKLKIS